LASIVEIYNTNGYNIISLLNEGEKSKSEVPIWILALGGGGLVVGLALFGYKILRALGVKLIKISASRGSCIELATAFVIVIGTILGLPLSTTHTMVGASIAVGIVDGVSQNGKKGFKSAVNGKLLIKIFSGWVLTLVVAAAVSALLFSMIVYAPSMETPFSYQNALNKYGTPYQDNMTIEAGSTLLVGLSNGKIDPLN